MPTSGAYDREPDLFVRRYTFGGGNVKLEFWRSPGTTLGHALALIEEVAATKSWKRTACARRTTDKRVHTRDRGDQRVSLTRSGCGLDSDDDYVKLFARLVRGVSDLSW